MRRGGKQRGPGVGVLNGDVPPTPVQNSTRPDVGGRRSSPGSEATAPRERAGLVASRGPRGPPRSAASLPDARIKVCCALTPLLARAWQPSPDRGAL